MVVSPAITDLGFREYVKNRVPKLANIQPIVRAMEKHGFVTPARFRELVRHDTMPYLITATGPNITHQKFQLPKRWWGFPNSTSTILNIDPETIANFDNPATLSLYPSKVASKRKVYLAGLAILQGMLVDGHQLAKSFDHDFISAKWVQFELDVYRVVIDGWEMQST
jgi:hypothetical protein